MSDARKTPKDIRDVKRKMFWEDIGNAGKLFGAALGLFALLGAVGGLLIKWESFVTQQEHNQLVKTNITEHHKIRNDITKQIDKERKESEALGYHEMQATEARINLRIENVEQGVSYIKDATDANGRRLEKMMDKLEAIHRRR